MAIRKHLSLMLVVAFFLSVSQAVAQHMPGERHTWRTVCTVAGVFGGMAIGGAVGWEAADTYRGAGVGVVVGGVGGGVGGYLLGRIIDKSKARNNPPGQNKPDLNKPDAQHFNEARARAMDIVAKEFAAKLKPIAEEPAPAR